ncbi:MAG: radical SAM protein [Planctomycetes bacterium]|nr:radical SAM protein [Planctomycetota bacterium]
MVHETPADCLKSSSAIRQWYEDKYYTLSLSGLWLKGGEPNTMPPSLFSASEVKFLICRLSTYRDVATSISHALVAQIAQEVEGVFTDFAFLPPPKDLQIMIDAKIPLWVGTTTKEPPCAFDVIGISNSFVLEMLNLPKLLFFSGIPLYKTERMKQSSIPLVVLGGANAAVTQVLHGPITEQGSDAHYGLVDAVFIGEGEYAIQQFLEIMKKGKSLGWEKEKILRECHGKVDGFYEPDKYDHLYKTTVQNNISLRELSEIAPKEHCVAYPVKSAIVYDLNQARTLESGPIWYEPENLGSSSIQISHGCPCFCSFCAESWERKPYRERSLAKLRESMKKAKATQGLDTINLMSFNFNTHAELYPMILSFYREMANVNLKSQRFDLLSTDKFLAEVQRIIGKTTVSCGMEGISERLRRYLHKNLTEDQIYTACEFLFENGMRELKIFLIYTGLETEEDIAEFSRFVKSLADVRSLSHCNTRIIFSLTRLYYPPHTPLQFHRCQTALEENKKLFITIENICKANAMEFRESASHEDTWLMQLLAMGDRRLTPALIRSSLADDFVYYTTVSKQVRKNWNVYLTEMGLSEKDFFREKTENQILSWDEIDTGIAKHFLWKEYERSIQFTERDYCLGRECIEAKCLGCGACPTADHIKSLTHHKTNPPFFVDEITQIAHGKNNILTLQVIVEIQHTMRLVTKRFTGVCLARALMMALPDITPYYHSLSGHIRNFMDDSPAADFAYGINIYHLSFLSNAFTKKLLQRESLLQKIEDIQKYCSGFIVREIMPGPTDESDVKFILYRIQFPRDISESHIEQRLGKYLHDTYVKHTRLKKEGCALFRVDEKSRKKSSVMLAKINKNAVSGQIEEGFHLIMIVTDRFDFKSFLEECYGFERRREFVRTHIEALGYYGRKPSQKNGKKCIHCNNQINEIFIAGRVLKENYCLICGTDSDKIMSQP